MTDILSESQLRVLRALCDTVVPRIERPDGAAFNPLAPFGGYKQSGHGRELGAFGILEFTQVKAIQL